MPSEGIQRDEWTAYVMLDTYDEDVPRDRLRDASPRVTESQYLVVGVTPHQGVQESWTQGKVAQVTG
jgi:hypothetical protein